VEDKEVIANEKDADDDKSKNISCKKGIKGKDDDAQDEEKMKKSEYQVRHEFRKVEIGCAKFG
jgi:hypothetical protein